MSDMKHEHDRFKPVLAKAQEFDIATNPVLSRCLKPGVPVSSSGARRKTIPLATTFLCTQAHLPNPARMSETFVGDGMMQKR